MASRVVELTRNESVVLGAITEHKCISANEMAYRTDLAEGEIERAIPVLESHRLIYQIGGYPKRYKVRETAKKNAEKQSSDSWIDPDAQYEAEAMVAGDVVGSS